MRSFVAVFSGLMFSALVVVLASAQGTVNFSGTWVVDKSQSDMAQLMGLRDDADRVGDTSMTMVVEQKDSNLRVTRVMKTQGEERKEIHMYKIGGGETTNTGFFGETVIGRAFWEGNQLVIVSTRTRKAFLKEISIESRGVWSLSADGKSLTIITSVQAPSGERRGKFVLDKR